MSAIEADWHMAGPLEISKRGDSLLINPAVVDNPTLVWSREPIPSDNFEVTIVLSALLPTPDVNAMFDFNGVGFWYCYEGPESTKAVSDRNEKRRHKRKPKASKGRFGNFGYKDDFDGLGAFLFFDGDSPMMTALTNTPPDLKRRDDATGAIEGIGLYEAFHNTKRRGEIKIKMRVEPNKATIDVHGDVISVEGSFRAGGHLGFTAASSSYEKDESLVPTLVEIKDLKIRSFVPLVELPTTTLPPVLPKEPDTPATESYHEPDAAVLPAEDLEFEEEAAELSMPIAAAAPRVESGLRRQLRTLQAEARAQAAQLAALQRAVQQLKNSEF